VPELQEYYEGMERARAAAVEAATKKYRSLTPILCKVEELVAGTNNGRSGQLAGYYLFWEQAVFNALAVMLLRGLDRLHAMFGPAARQPLFRVGGVAWLVCMNL
jgi:dynein heavy chain